MKNDVAFVLLIGLIIILYVLPIIMRIIYSNMILSFLNSRNYIKAEKIIDDKVVKLLFSPFNIEYMKLNSKLLQNDKSSIDNAFKKICSITLTKEEKKEVYLKGFNYYAFTKDEEKCKEFKNLIISLNDEKLTRDIIVVFNTLLEKGYKFLDETIEICNNLPDNQKCEYEKLISMMYMNKGDYYEADRYNSLSNTHLKESEQKKR